MIKVGFSWSVGLEFVLSMFFLPQCLLPTFKIEWSYLTAQLVESNMNYVAPIDLIHLPFGKYYFFVMLCQYNKPCLLLLISSNFVLFKIFFCFGNEELVLLLLLTQNKNQQLNEWIEKYNFSIQLSKCQIMCVISNTIEPCKFESTWLYATAYANEKAIIFTRTISIVTLQKLFYNSMKH